MKTGTHTLKAYWWDTHANYGDFLSPVLLNKFTDKEVELATPQDADIICIGSILEHLPLAWKGTVIGSGLLKEHSNIDLSKADVLALRGKLSAGRVITKGDFALGDPALLISEIIPPPAAKIYDLTVVPHWSDKVLAKRFAHLNPNVIDPKEDAISVVQKIAASKKVVASGLHGIIIADSYRIPRRAERHPNIDKSYEGGEFKYHDYASVLNETMEFGVLHMPDERYIEIAQVELFEAFAALAKKFGPNGKGGR